MKNKIKELIITKDALIVDELLQHPAYDIATEIQKFQLEDQIIFFNMIPTEKSIKIFKYIRLNKKCEILINLYVDKARILINSQPIDDLVQLLRKVNSNQKKELLTYLHKSTKHMVEKLLAFESETAGSLVTSEYLRAKGCWSVKRTLDYIRKFSKDVESVSYIYVLDAYDHLKGVVSIRQLLLALDEDTLSNIMIRDVISVCADANQQEVVRMLTNYNFSALPVVVDKNKMVGIITFDDVMDIMKEEATEDIQKLGGSEPLSQSYFESSIWNIFVKRIPWLLLLFIAEAYTGTVLKFFEDEIETVVALAFFVPLLVGTGGNTGTQVVATIIRAVGIGEVQFKDIFRVIRKEILIGILLGLSLGTAGLIRAYMLGVGTEVAQVVAITMVFIVVWASIIASALPLILRQFKLDPAVVSGPFITTFVDGTGLVIYFMVAKLILNLSF
ncbi:MULTISPECIES: magnesium transporter [Bacillus cereus group]|uniref:magnesium transporter n=1 Tax=Bacillus cereus group TaxID=86661 RepID=UPI000BF7B696|nr:MULTISPECIES: magnesium transporter [Bacillus cereus group]PFI79111.1 magnesium transporter [Bacillus cereus]